MTNFTLGRIGLDADIDDVSQWDSVDETVTVAFSTPMVAEGGSLLRSNAYRQMILGYAESPDQLFVPVTWADEPTVNGYYRVVTADVTPDPDLALEGLYYFTAQLERVQGGFGMPAVQTTFVWNGRQNVHNQTGSAYLATPNSGTRWLYGYEPTENVYAGASPTHVLASSDGEAVQVVIASNVGGSGPSAGELGLLVRNIDPESYYAGAARFEVGGFAVEGRQVPRNWEDNWRLTNGIIELKMDSNGITNEQAIFQVRDWQGTQWGDALPVTLRGDEQETSPRDPFRSPSSVTILKNTTEEVVIRFALSVGDRDWPGFLDITCRRGIRTFACRLRRSGNTYPAVSFPDILTKYFWRREGAWVNLGTVTKYNYMWNPRCTDDGTYWDRYSSTGTATGRITFSEIGTTGITTGFRVTASAAHATAGFGVEQGLSGTSTPNNGLSAATVYSAGAWVRCSVSRTLTWTFQWRNSSGALLSSVTQDVAVTANTWTQVKIENVTSPASTVRVSCRITGNAAGNAWTTGDTLDMAGVQAEPGATLDSFWDGDSSMSDAVNTAWANELAPNTRSVKCSRTSPVGQPIYWMTSPVAFVMDTDGFEPDPGVDSNPVVWHFGIGANPSTVTSGDSGRYIREVTAYYVTIQQSDDVVAV